MLYLKYKIAFIIAFLYELCNVAAFFQCSRLFFTGKRMVYSNPDYSITSKAYGYGDIKPFFLIASNVEEGDIILTELSDHESDGEWLGLSIQEWLDSTSIVLDFHRKIGLEVTSIYIRCRKCGVNSLAMISKEIDMSLRLIDLSDMSVSASGIVEKVKQFIKQNQAINGTGPISQCNIERIHNEIKLYESSEFARYRLLRDFMDGKMLLVYT